MKRIASIILALAIMLSLSVLTGCSNRELTGFEKQINANEANVKAITSQYDTPQLTRSLDYENVIRRAEYLNQGNTVGYLYLLSDTGMVLEEVQVAGKVTSLNTFITPMQESQYARLRRPQSGTNSLSYLSEIIVVDAPDIDGTWGENVSGIFWFTPDGTYGEWIGLYRFSSERLSFQSEPILFNIND